jgi:hypothetical protein
MRRQARAGLKPVGRSDRRCLDSIPPSASSPAKERASAGSRQPSPTSRRAAAATCSQSLPVPNHRCSRLLPLEPSATRRSSIAETTVELAGSTAASRRSEQPLLRAGLRLLKHLVVAEQKLRHGRRFLGVAAAPMSSALASPNFIEL